MHQPWYLDPCTGKMLLPWVRLHGVSAYWDMAKLFQAYPDLRATISFSPALLDQLHYLVEGGQDIYEQLTLRDANDLSLEDRISLLKHFFSVHWGNILANMPYYLELLEKRGREVPKAGWVEAASHFSTEEIRDLQILFNLAWCGFSACKDPDIQQLLARQKNYSEEDKHLLLQKQHDILSQLLPLWRELFTKKSLEAGCSPYYHPILPLLVDSNIAKRSNPEAHLPERFCFPQDAEVQIQQAVLRVEQEFGIRPMGLWPSEAAISPEIIPLVQKCHMQYVIADSEILFHSLDDRGSTPGRRRMYQPYRVDDCTIFFSDSALSTSIAKGYSSWADSRAAAADFLQKIVNVRDVARVDGNLPPLVVIALDGENPWEAYPNRGYDFLSALYEQLNQQSSIEVTTLQGYLERYSPTVGLEYLHSGSWIEGNYAVWIGDPDKNRAWNLLGRARRRFARAQTAAEKIPEDKLKEAFTHLLRAEGADWFWWMGEPFTSVEEQVYEALYRNHLTAMYWALGDSPPADLSQPIEFGNIVHPLRQPTMLIQPRIDGKRTSFFEWRGAGFYRVPASGSMYQAHAFIVGLYWGFDAGRIFLRIDPIEDSRERIMLTFQNVDLWFELTEPERCITGKIELTTPPRLVLSATVTNGQHLSLGSLEEIAFAEVIETAIPISRLGLSPKTRLGLSLHFAREGQVLSRVPSQGVIEIEIPGDEFGL